jgi:hypothetical protein
VTEDATLLLRIHAGDRGNALYAIDAAAREGLDDARVSSAYAELLKLGYVGGKVRTAWRAGGRWVGWGGMLKSILLAVLIAIPAAAQPTTQPKLKAADPEATQRAVEFRRVVTELREEISDLKSQNALLAKENGELHARIAKLEADAVAKGGGGAKDKSTLAVGMSRDDAAAIYRTNSWAHDTDTSEQLIGGKSVTVEVWTNARPKSRAADFHGAQVNPRAISLARDDNEVPGQPQRVVIRNGVVVSIEK